MKKVLSLIICLIVVITVSGCGKKNSVNHAYELESSNKDIKIVFENEIDKDIKLETKMVDNYMNLSNDIKEYVLHSISLVKYVDGEKEKINPDNVTVLVKIPDGYNKDKLAIYYVPNGVIMNALEFEVDGKYAKFETEHLGNYAVAELK